ncbi:esterase/lipase family protein, partial [Nocardia sp. NPDC056541]|uniref:esterase/lipase family protein n=1 Tax=Nocardia sp. NPDC056541 TaxID=3345860 RepID=UPI00366FCEA3
MKSPSRRRTLHTAVFAGVGALSMVFTGPGASAAPASAPTEQDLAGIISEGRQVAGSGSACTSGSGAGSGNGSGDCYGGSGSSSGSSGGYSSDPGAYGPESTAFLAAFAYGLGNPDAAAPGTNDWNCKPTAEHPRPVVLLHGTWMNAYNGYAYMGQPIKDAGYCTFTFNYGRSNIVEGGGLGSFLPGV